MLEYACAAADNVSGTEEYEIAQAGLRRGRVEVWEEESRERRLSIGRCTLEVLDLQFMPFLWHFAVSQWLDSPRGRRKKGTTVQASLYARLKRALFIVKNPK